MSVGGALTCPRDGTSTRLTCVECQTPICPKCSVRTPVGLKCPDHATAPGAARRRAGNRRSRAGMALLAAAAVAGGVYAVQRLGVSEPATFPCPTQTAPDVGIGPESRGTSWSEMERSPLCGRFSAATAWTGTEFVVWGGQNCAGEQCPAARSPRMSDGGAYDPARDRWRRIADSPLEGRDSPASVWTGKELLVWGGSGRTGDLADGAAYDPARDRWRPLAPSPLTPRAAPGAVWTGREMVVWGGRDAGGARYDPEADRWEPLPPSGAAAWARPVAAWTGAEVLVWSSADGDGAVAPSGRAYDPARNAWRPLPPGPLTARSGVAAVWTGRELLIWGGDNPEIEYFADGAAYDPTADRWRPLATGRVSPRSNMLAVWTGSEMLVWGGLGNPDVEQVRPGLSRNSPFLDPLASVPLADGAAYDPATDRWRRLEDTTLLARAYPLGAWDGQRLLVWGGITLVDSIASAADGARHTP
ncbi:MAG: Kelch repeat-containing protein [Acidimicrobiia bacterium]